MRDVKRNFIFSTFEEIEKLNANPAVSTYSELNLSWFKFKSGQGEEAADITNITARRGNAVLV